MKYFVIILAIICFLASLSAGSIFADETANTGDTAADKETSPSAKKESDDNFSDYPKSFIVPKGVCETQKEPAMTIDNKSDKNR